MTTPPDRSLRLFSWNLWFGAGRVDDGPAKALQIVRDQQADLVFLQECFGPAGAEIAEATGMHIAQQGHDTAVLAPTPLRLIETDTEPYATAALVETVHGEVLAWSIHLEHTDYGPYRGAELPAGAATVFAQRGERRRDEQAQAILLETARIHQEHGPTPVIAAGDFNVPSPDDWHGRRRPAVDWPATRRFIDAGYTDAFRHVHPDTANAPGLTWSHIEPAAAEPRDRIDFIYVRGLDVDQADHYGAAADDLDVDDHGLVHHPGPCDHIPDHAANAFPSDHLAVRATVRT